MTLDELEEEFDITEERKEQFNLSRKRQKVEHTLVLYRDKPSVTNMEAMFRHLREAGMPDTATLYIAASSNNVRFCAQWSTEPQGVEE